MRLLSRMCGGKAFARIRMQDARFRDPPIEQFSHAHPGQSVPLAATDQSSPPQQGQPEPEHMEALKVRWWSKAVNFIFFLSLAALRTPANPWDTRFPLCVGGVLG